MPFENFTDNWKEGYWSKQSNITFVGFFGNGDHIEQLPVSWSLPCVDTNVVNRGKPGRGLTDFIMDQNFLGSLVHVESQLKKCFLASRILVTTILFLKVLNLLSQSCSYFAYYFIPIQFLVMPIMLMKLIYYSQIMPKLLLAQKVSPFLLY